MEKEDKIKEIRKGLHDINNNLTVITASCSSLLLNNKSESETRQYLRYSIDSAKQVGVTVEKIFSLIKEL